MHSDVYEMSENYDDFWYFIIFTDDYMHTSFCKVSANQEWDFQTFKNFLHFYWT
jgi:hypothetical protein